MTTKDFNILLRLLNEAILDDLSSEDISGGQPLSNKLASLVSSPAYNRMLTISILFGQDVLKLEYLENFNFLREILKMESCVLQMGCFGGNVSDVKCRFVVSDIDMSENVVYWFDVNSITAEEMSQQVAGYAEECADKHLLGWLDKPEKEIWLNDDYAIAIRIIMDFEFNNDDLNEYPYSKFYKDFSRLAIQVKNFERKCEFLSKYNTNHFTEICLQDGTWESSEKLSTIYSMKKNSVRADRWRSTEIIGLYTKLCPDGEYSKDDIFGADKEEKKMLVEYVSPILRRLYLMMQQDDPDYKFWMIGYQILYDKSTIRAYLFLRPKDLQSTNSVKVSNMTAWVNYNIIDALTPSDILRICGQAGKTTVELRFNVGSNFIPVNDTKGKSLDSLRIIQAGTRTQLIFKISYHDGMFNRFGRTTMNSYNQSSEAFQASRNFKEGLEKGLFGNYGKRHVKDLTSWLNIRC